MYHRFFFFDRDTCLYINSINKHQVDHLGNILSTTKVISRKHYPKSLMSSRHQVMQMYVTLCLIHYRADGQFRKGGICRRMQKLLIDNLRKLRGYARIENSVVTRYHKTRINTAHQLDHQLELNGIIMVYRQIMPFQASCQSQC